MGEKSGEGKKGKRKKMWKEFFIIKISHSQSLKTTLGDSTQLTQQTNSKGEQDDDEEKSVKRKILFSFFSKKKP